MEFTRKNTINIQRQMLIVTHRWVNIIELRGNCMSCDFKDTQQTLFCNTNIEMVRGLSNEKFHPERQQEGLI